MDTNIERFQEKLAALEKGEPIEDCLEGLQPGEVKLFQLAASSLRRFQPPARKQSVVMAQLDAITHMAEEPQATRAVLPTAPRVGSNPTRQPWFPAVAAASSALVLFVSCLFVLLLGTGISRLAYGVITRLNPGQAFVQEVRGLVERQAKDGHWAPVNEKTRLKPGAPLRTGWLSSALLTLEDGSQVSLGPQTEIVLDQIGRSLRGDRVIRITQWQGETQHDVQPITRRESIYEVRTPSATSTARGTSFTVRTDPEGGTRVKVTAGTVEVTGIDATVPVSAGQVTHVTPAHAPTDPAFLIQGEGILEISAEHWAIAGQEILLSPEARRIGTPENGDLVAFVGQQLPDGKLQVDRLEYLMTPATIPFRLTGSLEATADTGLIAASSPILIDAHTRIAGEVAPGEDVTVEGVIQADQSWLATSVDIGTDGQPFAFSGVVQSVENKRWMISGIEVVIDEDTRIEPEMAVGEVVAVQGWIQKNGDWLAGSILPAAETEAVFDFTGTVKDTGPWIVAGIPFETRTWTQIDPEIEPGDRVRVRGPILADGTWVAAAIQKIEEAPEEVSLVFVGTLNSIDPWVVSGIPLLVDADTWITKDVIVGSLVEVRAIQQPDGSWYAKSITSVVPGSQGCITFASVVVGFEDSILTLQDGSTIDLNAVEQVEGEIEMQSVILVVKCMGADGTLTYPLIRVVDNPTGGSTPTPTLTQTSTLTPTPLPQSLILPNCYKITFMGTVDNGDGTSSWRYSVEELSYAQDLSNWVLELPDCAQFIDASPSPWEAVHPDPNHQLNGIKWQTGAGFERGEFMVTLAGDLTTGTTRVGAKGPDVAIGAIAGPVCDLIPVTPSPTPTITITPTPTLTLTATVEMTSTETPTATVEMTLTPTVFVPTATQPAQAPPSISGPIVIRDNDQVLTINCNGAAVTVNGNNNTLTLLGACSSLTVRGNNNRISLESPTSVTNTGNENVIR